MRTMVGPAGVVELVDTPALGAGGASRGGSSPSTRISRSSPRPHGSAPGHGPAPASWAMAASATLHCLTGCAIGEVLGMVIGTSVGLSDWATVALAVALAFVFGYALTMRGVLRAGLPVRQALRVALAADTLSIAVMEVVDNAVVLSVPGAMEAGISTALFWLALAGALAVAFVVTLPINRAMMSRGRGHAVVHGLHG